MELEGQDKEVGMPSTLSYNPSIRESSAQLSSPAVASTTVGERGRDQTVDGNSIVNPPQTLDQHRLYPPPPPQHTGLHPHQNTHKPRRDPDQQPDPVANPVGASGATVAPISTSASTVRSLPPQAQTTSTIRAAVPKIRYRECLKNHAASAGGHVVDGCGEFMPSGEEGTLEGLKCAACECHRNFHRKEVEGESQRVSNSYYTNPIINNGQREIVPPRHHPPLPPQPHVYHQHPNLSHGLSKSLSAGPNAPLMMAFGGGGGGPAESSSEDLNMFRSNICMQTSAKTPQSKKRFRTRFTQEQKEKMMEFAEKLGWRIQKHDEQEVQQFCSVVGVKRQVFKVWMHNNKQAMKKKQM